MISQLSLRYGDLIQVLRACAVVRPGHSSLELLRAFLVARLEEEHGPLADAVRVLPRGELLALREFIEQAHALTAPTGVGTGTLAPARSLLI